MKSAIVSLALTLAALSAAGQVLLLESGPVPEGFASFRIVRVPDWRSLDAACAGLGSRPGRLPALVDPSSGAWTALSAGDSPSGASARLAAEAAALALARETASLESKPAALKSLEAEYFALADALAAEAGDSPMSEADAKDPAKVRAKYSKAKAAKNAAAGQNKKATAEALLAITELRGDLLMVESALGAMDPRWRERARKPVSP